METSIANPNGNEAKSILKLIDSLLKINGGKVLGSPGERKMAIGTIISMVQFFGCPSVFFTFAPDDIHSALTLRMSCPTKYGNHQFPAVDYGFEKNLQNRNMSPRSTKIMDDQIDISELNLHYLLNNNPVAAAHVFKLTLEAIFEILFGIVPDYLTKITIPISKRCKGIFGTTKAAYTVTEVQGRLSLHGHMTVWSVLCPTIIQQGIQCYKLLDSIKEVILSQIRGNIPKEYHLNALERQVTPPAHRSLCDPPRAYYDSLLPSEDETVFKKHVHNVVNSTAVHQHSHTCVKGPLGHIGCRLSYPSNCTNGNGISISELKLMPSISNNLKTKAINDKNKCNEKKNNSDVSINVNIFNPNSSKINIIVSDDTNKDNKNEIQYEEIEYKKIKFYNIENDNIIKYKPLGLSDNRCIVVEIQKEHEDYKKIVDIEIFCKDNNLQFIQNLDKEIQEKTFEVICSRNGGVVNYSPTASAVLRCNTAAYHLGGNEQAKATLFYLIKYITKDAMTPTTSLSLISYARSKVFTHPSIANDTGTDIRTGQHLLTVMLNKSRSCKEIADTQAAVSLLNMPAQFGSVKNNYVFIKDACRIVKERVKEDQIGNSSKKQKKTINKISTTNEYNKNIDNKMLLDYNKIIHHTNNSKTLNLNEIKDISNEHLGKYESDTICPGTSTFYEVKTNYSNFCIPVSQDINYAYRGIQLKELSLFEYMSIIEIVPILIKKITKNTIILPQRKNNTTYKFQIMHPLHLTHHQKIRSKLLIPLLVGGSPMNFNAIDDNNIYHIYSNCSDVDKKYLNKAAMYYLTLTSPWNLQADATIRNHSELIPEGGHTFNDFVHYMNKLKCYSSETNTYNAPFLKRCLFTYIVDTSRNMRTRVQNKVMLAKHRGRSSDTWEKNHNGPSTYPKIQTVCQSVNYWRHRYNMQNYKKNFVNNLDVNCDINHQETSELITSLQNDCSNMTDESIKKNEASLKYLNHSLQSLTTMQNEQNAMETQCINTSPSTEVCDKIWNSIREKEILKTDLKNEIVILSSESIHTGNKFTNFMEQISTKTIFNPTNDQINVLKVLKSHLHEFKNEQFLLFIHGGPGVGKTWTVNEFKNMLTTNNEKFLCTAFTGVAASLLNGGETLHSLFQFHVGRKKCSNLTGSLTDTALRMMHAKFKDCKYIMIDEISMVGSLMMYKIHNRLQEIKGNSLPFGGINMLVVGDFFQIIPVGDSCLYKDIIKYIVLQNDNEIN